jgi:hypothetical protein
MSAVAVAVATSPAVPPSDTPDADRIAQAARKIAREAAAPHARAFVQAGIDFLNGLCQLLPLSAAIFRLAADNASRCDPNDAVELACAYLWAPDKEMGEATVASLVSIRNERLFTEVGPRFVAFVPGAERFKDLMDSWANLSHTSRANVWSHLQRICRAAASYRKCMAPLPTEASRVDLQSRFNSTLLTVTEELRQGHLPTLAAVVQKLRSGELH